ncbi:TOMM precursor leader peptide-binding protein [Nocardia sp. NPDC003979]
MTTREQPIATAVEVVGEGILADGIRATLLQNEDARQAPPLRVVVTGFGAEPLGRSEILQLAVRAELGEIVIGPLEQSDRPGCGSCLEWRRRQARRSTSSYDAIRRKYHGELAQQSSAWMTDLAVTTVTAVITSELERLEAGRPARTEGAILIVHLDDLSVSRHQFLPNPQCEECGSLPSDSPVEYELGSDPRPKLALDMYRARAIAEELPNLKDLYVDRECGIIREIVSGTMGGLVVANAPIRLADGRDENGFGRTRSYRRAELVAILEALERLGGTRPGGKRTVVTAAYSDVADRAVNPETLGLHSKAAYSTPGFRFRPFTPSAVCHWVWGYSLTRDEPILVPETLAYYRLHQHTDEQRGFCYDLSNGCALGSSIEEAVLHGILEIIERDAFLMTWYSRLAAPRLDLEATTNLDIKLTATAIRVQTGYDLQLFDTTMEHGIPSTLALAVNTRDVWPKMTCTAASSLNPEQSVLNALDELGPIVQSLSNLAPTDRDKAALMVNDPNLVVTMDDHTTLYTHPDAYRRLDFLTTTTESAVPATTDEMFRNTDLADDLAALVHRLAEHGLHVLFVDQTTAEHRHGGLACVKVLIPGTVPMTFGHLNRRLDGLPRVLNAPLLRGASRPLLPDEVNPHPHPFP